MPCQTWPPYFSSSVSWTNAGIPETSKDSVLEYYQLVQHVLLQKVSFANFNDKFRYCKFVSHTQNLRLVLFSKCSNSVTLSSIFVKGILSVATKRKMFKYGVFSDLYFPVFCISKYGKIRTRRKTVFGHFLRNK